MTLFLLRQSIEIFTLVLILHYQGEFVLSVAS